MKWRTNTANFISIFVIFFGIYECFLGIGQLTGFISSGHSRYPITGSFSNPGPYCGFLAMLVPIAFSYFLKNCNRFFKLTSGLYLVAAIFIMPILMGRTGWFGAAAGCFFVYVSEKGLKIRRRYLAIIASAALILIPLFIYIKPASALGRLFLWRCGFKAWLENPLGGVGRDYVLGALGNAQEAYFATHPCSIFEAGAGVAEYTFNEFLHIAIAHGIFALLFFIIILTGGIWSSYKSGFFGLGGAIISFCLFAFASYPLEFIECTSVLFLILAASFIAYNKIGIGKELILIFILLGVLIQWSGDTYMRAKREVKWKNISYLYKLRLSDDDISRMDSLHQYYSFYSVYLFDCGKSLRENGLYDKSNDYLLEGSQKFSDPMFLNLIGRNYQDIGNYQEAERAYKRSINRLPNRFYPHYLLAKMYADSASFNKAGFKQVYHYLMNKYPKVPSEAISEMKREMKQLNDSIDAL